MSGLASQSINIIFGLAVVAWLLWKQFRTRRVQDNTSRIYFIPKTDHVAESTEIV